MLRFLFAPENFAVVPVPLIEEQENQTKLFI